MLQRNNVRPDLRAFANYNVNGIGTKLDGSSTPIPTGTGAASTAFTGGALANLGSNRFNNYTIGLRMDVALGTRDAHATLRVAQLNLARSYVVLRNQELKAERFLASIYQVLENFYAQIQAQRDQRIALGQQLEGQFELVRSGRQPLFVLLQAQQQFATALSAEFQAIANYNSGLAALQYAKGSIRQYDNVQILDGPVPMGVLNRATDHFRERSKALVVRERDMPLPLAVVGTPPALPGLLEGPPPPMTPPAPLDEGKPGMITPPPVALPGGTPPPAWSPATTPAAPPTLPAPAPKDAKDLPPPKPLDPVVLPPTAFAPSPAPDGPLEALPVSRFRK